MSRGTCVCCDMDENTALRQFSLVAARVLKRLFYEFIILHANDRVTIGAGMLLKDALLDDYKYGFESLMHEYMDTRYGGEVELAILSQLTPGVRVQVYSKKTKKTMAQLRCDFGTGAHKLRLRLAESTSVSRQHYDVIKWTKA